MKIPFPSLQDEIEFYEDNVESPRTAITESSTATKNLSNTITDAKKVLTKIDSLVDTFDKSFCSAIELNSPSLLS